ncbi:HAD hydrolase-like protein [Sodalis glossinidius]|uniref:HAD hydrolase-like protein n=1 Tax=Sodalis glossinidius TaxID=63612 RepID=UPI001FB07724|nr:HAD hydrolase-like protein [Sodalis glossinidius]
MQRGFSIVTKIKAVIFDMDGMLIEAKDWHYDALNKALNLFGLEITRQEHQIVYDGLSTKDKLIMLSRDKGLSQSLHEFINDDETKIYDGNSQQFLQTYVPP